MGEREAGNEEFSQPDGGHELNKDATWVNMEAFVYVQYVHLLIDHVHLGQTVEPRDSEGVVVGDNVQIFGDHINIWSRLLCVLQVLFDPFSGSHTTS